MSAPESLFRVRRIHGDADLNLALEGELDFVVSGALEDAARDVPAGGRVVLDLRALEFMDSAGLRTLMTLDLRAREEGWTLALARPQAAVLRLLRVSGVEGRMTILDA